MPTTCGFPSCKFRSRYRGQEDNRHFYRIPKRPPQLRQRWLHAIGRTEETVVSQLRICSAHFAGGEKKEGDIPVPDPQFDPPLFISLPPRGESLRYNNAEQRQQRLLTKRLKLLNNKNQYISNQPITINKRQNGRTLKGNSSVDANNSDISSANGGVHGNGSFASDGECSKFIDKFFESTYAALHRESPNDANAASTSAGLFGSTHQYQQQSALSLDLPSESNLAPFLNFLGMKSFGMHPGLNPQHAQQHSFSAGTSMQGTTSAPISSIVGSKPLVALLDGRDCTIEMPLLKDIATVAFCDAQTTAEIHEKVLNEAVAAILYHSISLSRDDLSKFKNLRTVVRIGSGFHNIDLNAATDFNIAVCNTPAESVDETAETTMIMILNMFRRTFWQAKITQTAQRNTFSVEQLRDMAKSCPRIRGSVLGIVGLGRIGMAVAMRARVFGFRVIFYDPYIPNGIERSLEIERCDTLDDLFRQSDCISLHCPLNGETRFMINADSVNKMKNGVAIVNTSAADLIIISVLLSGLKNGNIRAAALDIYERESSSFGDANNATFEMLCKMPNLLYTPHYAWYSDESSKELRMAAAREVRRALIGRSPDDLLNCVNREALIIKKTTSTALSLLATGNLPGIQQLAATNQFPFNRSSVAGAQTGSFFQSPTKMATMSRLSVPGARISHQALDASSLLGLLQQPGPGNSGAAQQQLQNLLAQLAAAGGQQTPTDLNSLAISLNATTNNLMYQDLLTTLSQQILNSQQQQQQIVNADTAGYSLAVSQGGSVPHESIPHSAYELGGGATTSLMGISTGGGGGSGRSSTSQQGGSAYDLPASSSSYRVAGTKRKDRSPLQSGVLQKMGVPESRVMSDSIPSEMRNEPMDATHINVEESGPQSMVDRHPVHQSPSSSKNGAINDRMNVDPDGLHSDTTRVDEGNNPEDPATEPIKEPCELN